MEWQQIIGFYHVVRLGSFTKAAQVTFRTQSALSQQIKALEKEFGCLLIERIGKRRLLLTAAGERFFEFAKSVLRDYDSLMEDMCELKGETYGRLTVAAPFTTLYHLFPDILKTYVSRFPHVELTILDRPQDTVVELVKNGDIDFGLVLKSQVPKGLDAIHWKKVETMLMTPIDHPLSKSSRISLKQIAQYPLIFPPKSAKHSYRRKLEETFRKEGIRYRIVMESSNVELTSLYVEMGMGISFATVVPDLPILKQRRLNFLPLKPLFTPDIITIVIKKVKNLPLHKKAFLEILSEKSN